MADDLSAWLSDIASKDQYLRSAGAAVAVDSSVLPPVRGEKAMPPAKKPQAAPTKAAAPPPKPAAPPPKPKDEAAIWDADELTPVPGAPSAPPVAPSNAAAPAAAPGNKYTANKSDTKPRHMHVESGREYFNRWDAFDVEGEVAKLEENPAKDAQDEADMPAAEGLPPDLTAAMLAKMPAVEVERRAVNEKNKGNEAYKANEYRTAISHYTYSLRLQQNNAVVYANRGMCYLKLKNYRQCLADCTAAIQIDDSYTKAYLRRGIAHRRLSQSSQALKDLDIVLHREPHNAEATEHRRCALIELEKAERERKEAEEKAPKTIAGRSASGKKSSVVIEEVDGDEDDEEEVPIKQVSSKPAPKVAEDPAAAAVRRLQEEERAKDARERARAEQAERIGRERTGPAVDPQAKEESDALLESLQMMNMGSGFSQEVKPKAPEKKPEVPPKQLDKKEAPPAKTMRRLAIEEDEDDDEEEVPIKRMPKVIDGFEPAKAFGGAKHGWVFKTGGHGLGYYREAAAAPAAAASAAAAPAAAAPAPAPTMKKLAIVEDEDEEEAAKAPAPAPAAA